MGGAGREGAEGGAPQAQLLHTAQRMAAVLATSSTESSVRTASASSTERGSSSAYSATSVSELKGETRKCRTLLRQVQSEMAKLRDAKSEAVRTGRLPGEGLAGGGGSAGGRRKVLHGDAEELWRTEQVPSHSDPPAPLLRSS